MRILLAALLVLAPSALAQEGCDFAEEELADIVRQAWPRVAELAGVEGPAPSVRIARARDVRDALREDLLPQMRALFPNEAQAVAVARQKAAQITSNLYAKTVFGTRDVLVQPRVFERLAKLLEDPDICSRETLRGVLVHELAHVADDLRFGLAATAARASSDQALRAADAMIEGHAQWIARRVCAELGWSAGFETFTASIDAYPPTKEGAAVDLVLRVRAAEAATSYVQGERFVDAVLGARGEDGLAALFAAPPADLTEVFRPDWYLEPASRPAVRARLGAGLDAFGRAHGGSLWAPTRTSLSLGQLAAGLASLPDEHSGECRRLLGAQLGNLGLFLGDGQGRQMSAILYEFPRPVDAAGFVKLNEALMRAKDTDMREGQVRILAADYAPLDEPQLAGVLATKRMAVNDDEQTVRALIAAREGVALELTFAAVEIEALELVELAGEILDAAFAPAPETRLELDFEELVDGVLPAGWQPAQTKPGVASVEWRSVDVPSAPSGRRALYVATEATGGTFNLLLSPETYPADLELAVSLCADTGEEDQGGGLVWRARGPDDYYIARWNPLEENLRVYRVVAGERTLLQNARTPVAPQVWHELEVKAGGARIEVALDGITYLDVEDGTFPEGGRVGLWTKADASTWFDDLVVR